MKLLFLFSLLVIGFQLNAQTLQSGDPVLEEAFRRWQLEGKVSKNISFALRPFELSPDQWNSFFHLNQSDTFSLGLSKTEQRKSFNVPTYFRQKVAINTGKPYGWGNGAMVPNVGIQSYSQIGFSLKASILRIQFSPEFVWTQNKPYQGFGDGFDARVYRAKYRYWSFGDYPERYGDGSTSFFWWGQSKITIQAGAFETGLSTENIWWGPGQFSALTFSNNARSFPHFTLNTRRPAKTFLGTFEAQLLVGKIEDSGIAPSQIQALNDEYFAPFSGDFKYLNALTITYQPKWIPGFFVGVNRTHQQYNSQRGNDFIDYFPVLEPFQKSVYGFDKDDEGRDQQVTFFGRAVIPSAKAEVYFEYGRRDHAFNWREATLNPEHARAYLLGFQKLFHFGKTYQVRAEMLNQQESINRTIRYAGLGGSYTWHTHGQARGFTNFGEALGTGPGVGSNVQTLEISQVDGLNKRGILLERLANNQDFFYRAFGRNPEKKPWIDFSLGLLWDQQFNRLILSGKAQFIRSINYQWESEDISTTDYPNGQKKFAFFGNFHLTYNLKK
ncbi:capsule assembly Wzi family protein [Algoriphagus pacificus]|uniref:Capsule assembly protein Wzi n=1 Tax=Algoriphagus pacificus TaxID=2811234 RepID=A0ABS3CKL6_9BACT|nr:capsule assembly Wzi family protein [Algoriphagus pacificus]MBN7817577.1 hypothetical protein [Algoriphagus pacificus]